MNSRVKIFCRCVDTRVEIEKPIFFDMIIGNLKFISNKNSLVKNNMSAPSNQKA